MNACAFLHRAVDVYCNGTFAESSRTTMMKELDMKVNNSGCAWCTLEPPPDILQIPPPPFPAILQQTSDFYSNTDVLPFPPLNDSPCRHFCDQRSEGVQYIEMPQQGFHTSIDRAVVDDTWLLVLVSSCIGVIFVGIVLAALFLKCKFHGSNKNGVVSIQNAAATLQTKNGRIQNETVLYPCVTDTIQDSRVMWATLTPRGTTKHYLEDHTYETIGNGQLYKHACPDTPTDHVYADPPVISPVHTRPKDDKAFDNTAFVDYEEPVSLKTDYYQMPGDLDSTDGGLDTLQKGTIRPRVSSPTRIENPNLPPLNLHPHKRTPRKESITSNTGDSLLRSSITSATYIPST